MNFGFSYIGLIFIAMLLIPNIIWTKHKPEGYDEFSKNENKILLIFERMGEALVMTLILIFRDCNIRLHSLWIGWLILTFVLMLLYEMYWIGYFKSEKKMSDMYSSYAGFPVAGASLPVFAVLSLGIYASNIFIIISSIILGIGHIGIHLDHRKEAVGDEKRGRKGRVIKAILLIPVCIIVLLIIGIIAIRNYNFFAGIIDTDTGVDESVYVDINDQEQFITIRGRDTSNPVIVYLHGGPGSPDSSMAYKFTNKLIDDYTVVCWDQRGCGRTYVKNQKIDKDNETVTFDQAMDDLDVLTNYLKDRFGTEKVIIMGHSYGSVLGSTYAYEHPENVSAFIGIGQFVNFESSAEYEYMDALEKAQAAGDDTTKLTEAYEIYKREKTVDAASQMSEYAAPYHEAPREKNTILAALVSPTLSSEDVLWYKNVTSYEKFMKYCGTLMDYTKTVNLRESQTEYSVPVLFISGECDWNCAVPDMIDYAELVGARYELIDGCGHYVHNDDPDEFARIVKDFLNAPEAADSESKSWEETFLLYLQDNVRTDFVSPIMRFFSFLGNSGWFWIVLCFALLIYKPTRPIGIIAAASLLISACICNGLLKVIVDRTRPYDAIEELELIAKLPNDSSFPSGHSNASFAVACAVTWCLSKEKKWIGCILITVAAIIAFSRLYVGAHYPTDVIAGILLGMGTSVVTYLLLRKKILQKEKEVTDLKS